MFTGYTADVQLIRGMTASEKLASYSEFIGIRWVIEDLGLASLGYVALSSGKKKLVTILSMQH